MYEKPLKLYEKFKQAHVQLDEGLQYKPFPERNLFLPGAMSLAQMQWRSKGPVSFEKPRARQPNLLLSGHYQKKDMLWSERQPAWKRGWTHYKEPTRIAEEQVPKRMEDTVMRYIEPGVYEKEPVIGPEMPLGEAKT